MADNWTENDIRKLIANPKFCLGDQPTITRDLWIKAATRRIKEDRDGGKSFLQDLLDHLAST
jgi:hypothetical protein